MRGLFLFIFLAPVYGQFNSLRTTDDGAKLYFSSVLQLSGTTDENVYERFSSTTKPGFIYRRKSPRPAILRRRPLRRISIT